MSFPPPATPTTYVSGVGLTVQAVREGILDGLPVVQGGLDVPEWLIRTSIDASEAKVEADLDALIWERDVYCTDNLDDSDLDIDDDRLLLSALDKPMNWFSGNRRGVLHLPKGPAKRVLRVTIKPYGIMTQPLEVPLDRVRLDERKLRFVPGPMGFLFGSGYANAIYSYLISEDISIPGGIEIVYRAGLSPRQLRMEGGIIPTLVMIQASILTLGMVQARLGAGAQSERVDSDGLGNTVTLANRSLLGPLGGEIKALKANYNDLMLAARANSNLSYMFLG